MKYLMYEVKMSNILSGLFQNFFNIYFLVMCLFVIIVIIAEIINIIALKIVLKRYIYIDDKIKKKITKAKNVLLLLFFFEIVNIICAKFSINKTSFETTTDDINASNNSEIVFFTIDKNEQYTVWEQLLLNDLKYSFFESEIALDSSHENIINDYHGEITNYFLIQQISIENIIKIIDKCGGILPETEMTIEEIDAIIDKYHNKSDVPVGIYIQELVLRIDMTKNSLTKDNAYQAGRAAHDVVTGLIADGSFCNKELLFFSALSYDFYILSISFQEGEISNDYILYRCGMLFLDLADCKELTQEMEEEQRNNYLQHCYLMAEAFFNQIIQRDSEELISKRIYHIYYYYGYTLYRLVQKYKYENIAQIAIVYLQEYERLPSRILKLNYVDQCEYMIKYLQ